MKAKQILTGHSGPVWNCKFSSNGNYCLTGGHDKTIRLWNPHKGSQVQIYKGHSYEVLDIAITTTNTNFASCGKERVVLLWDAETGKTTKRFHGHTLSVNAVAFNQSSNVLASGSEDKKVHLWDLLSNNKDPIQVLEEANDSISSVTITDNEIIAGSIDGYVRIYDMRMGKLKMDYMHRPVIHLSMSGDANCILVGCLDNSLRLINKEDGVALTSYKGHTNEKYLIKSCVSYDDAFVLSGSEDNKIFIWDLVEATVINQLEGHKNVICGLSYHPTQNMLLSSSVDGTAIFWA